MKVVVFTIVTFLAIVEPLPACPLKLEKTSVQGALLVGKAPVGSQVRIDDKITRISNKGYFLVGFGRNAKSRKKVTAFIPGGRRIDCIINVKKRRYKVERIDGLLRRMVVPSSEDIKRIRVDNAAIAKVRRLNTFRNDFLVKFKWPLRGRISGVFGSQRILNGKPKRPHNGVDIAAPEGTKIHAPAPGVVVLSHPGMFYTGKTLMLDHGHGLTSVYVHMSAISVKLGQQVQVGDKIGEVGKTGRATGSHLHWGVSLFSTHLDPELLAGKMYN
ncbi:MAG: peptidase M23 [Magnetovibrio sp.]|nr:peptidase M23 [Magnetovibrio sp.]